MIPNTRKICLALSLLAVTALCVAAARAQDAPSAAAAPVIATADQVLPIVVSDAQAIALVTQKLRAVETEPKDLGSLFFTPWQHALLQEAKRGFLSRPPTQAELNADPSDPAARPRGLREISLGGIVYARSKDWVIWLNGQRVTPDALPTQVIDLKVYKQYVELKWFDTYTNLIYPIRIHPHQRFNLDARIFLPGAGIL